MTEILQTFSFEFRELWWFSLQCNVSFCFSESIFNMYGLSSISAAGLRPAADNYHCLCKRKWFINQNLTHAEQQLPHGLVDRTVDLRFKSLEFESTLGRKFSYGSFFTFIISITMTITPMQKFIIFCNAKNNKFLH